MACLNTSTFMSRLDHAATNETTVCCPRNSSGGGPDQAITQRPRVPNQPGQPQLGSNSSDRPARDGHPATAGKHRTKTSSDVLLGRKSGGQSRWPVEESTREARMRHHRHHRPRPNRSGERASRCATLWSTGLSSFCFCFILDVARSR
jgi:hypothetical protein